MLSNAYFLAKFRFDTAENEPAKNLQNFANFPNFANPNPFQVRVREGAGAARPDPRWDFATFKADWTLRDDTVTQGLAAWGRAGVPLYIVYPADPNKPPQLLPELLTLGETLKAIQAGGQGGGA